MTPVPPLTDKPQLGGSVELIPERPLLIEFVGKKHTWGFPIPMLDHFVAANPEYDGKHATTTDAGLCHRGRNFDWLAAGHDARAPRQPARRSRPHSARRACRTDRRRSLGDRNLDSRTRHSGE